MKLWHELRRRNVVKVGVAYVLMGWVLLQGVDFALDLVDAPNWVMQVFFIAVIVGLPFALFFAWAYEMTPEGIKRETEVDRANSITRKTGRKIDFFIIGVLLVIIAFLGIERTWFAEKRAERAVAESGSGSISPESEPDPISEPEDARPSIAVLPFVNMSSDPEQDYFADGISEEILNSLARVSGLKVAGRTSSFAFKGRNEDLREIGDALGVQHILEGSVRKQGDQVRITAQLVQASDGFHLWSDTYDRKLEDIFAIQDEIATAILQQTRIQLLEDESVVATRVDPIAYQNYVAAKQRIHERTKGGLKVAMNLLKDAVALDPDFAGAWAQLGVATMLSSDGFGSYGDIPEAEAQRLGKEYLDRSLELDPDLAEGLAGMGLYWQNEPPFSREKRQRSIELLERSLALDPGPIDTSHWLGRVYQFTGRRAEAQKILESMVARDPLYWPAVSNLVFLYARQNRIAEARELNDRTMRYRPELPFRQQAMLLSLEGRFGEAVPLAMEVWAERQDPLVYGSLAASYAGVDELTALVDMEGAPDADSRAIALAILGRSEEAMQVAQADLNERGDPDALIAVLALTGQYQRLVSLMEERWPDLAAFDRDHGDNGGFGNGVMLNIALAYRKTGGDERFRTAMSLVRVSHEEQRASGFDTMGLDVSDAKFWALADEPEQALEHLERAVDRGYSATPRLSVTHPQLASLEGMPRYEELQARSLAHLNEQRALLDLPPREAAY